MVDTSANYTFGRMGNNTHLENWYYTEASWLDALWQSPLGRSILLLHRPLVMQERVKSSAYLSAWQKLMLTSPPAC